MCIMFLIKNEVSFNAVWYVERLYNGATENARPDIIIIIIIIIRNLYSAIMPLGGYRGAETARLDNSVPYRKGGHRETCFIVRIEAQYKLIFAAGSII